MSLTDLAHEIRVRLQKADDHRLSASLKLAEARAACKAEGVSFKAWVVAEIKSIGYPEATKLAKIGAAPDPAKALADFRAVRAGRERNRRVEKVGHVANSSQVALPAQIAAPAAALPRPGRGKEAICARVAEALIVLSGLPPAIEVANYFKGTDGAIIVDERLATAARWVVELHEAWGDAAGAEGDAP